MFHAQQLEEALYIQNLERLAPTVDELRAASRWAMTHDTSEPFESLCREVLEALGAGAALDDK